MDYLSVCYMYDKECNIRKKLCNVVKKTCNTIFLIACVPFVHLSQKSQKYKTTHIMKHANMKNTLSFVCLKNINNYKIEY